MERRNRVIHSIYTILHNSFIHIYLWLFFIYIQVNIRYIIGALALPQIAWFITTLHLRHCLKCKVVYAAFFPSVIAFFRILVLFLMSPDSPAFGMSKDLNFMPA